MRVTKVIAEKYGVGKVRFDGDDTEHACAQFGNGKTRIFTTVWDSLNVGIKISSLVDNDSVEAFSYHEYDDSNPPHECDGDEIHILFDNPKSIDAMIGRLKYIRDELNDKINKAEA